VVDLLSSSRAGVSCRRTFEIGNLSERIVVAENFVSDMGGFRTKLHLLVQLAHAFSSSNLRSQFSRVDAFAIGEISEISVNWAARPPDSVT
jgi:hypothetical protein